MTPAELSQLVAAPWAVHPKADLAAFVSSLQTYNPSCSFGKDIPPHAASGASAPILPNVSGVTRDGVGIVNIHGYILETRDAECFGCVSPSSVRAKIDALIAQGARAIYFDVASPGGNVLGVPDLADYIAGLPAIGVSTVAGTSSLCCSAAYWIASQCQLLVATRGALIGSIGVFMAIDDTSKLYQDIGIVRHVVASGELKGAGLDGTVVDDKQLAYFRERIEETFALFRRDLMRTRKNLSPEAYSGKDWHADGALARGLIDRVETVNPQPARKEA